MHFWFSNPAFDRKSPVDIRIFDKSGTQPKNNMIGTRELGADEGFGGRGWILYTTSFGTTKDFPELCDIELDYAIGPWEKTGADIPTDFRGSMTLGNNMLLGAIGQNTENKTFIRCVRDKQKTAAKQYNFIAISKDGAKLDSTLTNRSGWPQMFQEEFEFDIPLKDVNHFEFQTRPVRSIKFKNVSLKPDFKTDVKIETQNLTKNFKSKIERNMGFTIPLYDRNASLFGQYIGGNLTRFDIDYIDLKDFGLAVGVSPEALFKKQGKCSFYLNKGHELVVVRGTIIAPLFIPNPEPLKALPLTNRIQSMSKKEIIDQMKNNLGGNLVSKPVKLEKDIDYALITPEQKLIVMYVGGLSEDENGRPEAALTFWDLGQIDKTAVETETQPHVVE